MADEKVMTPKEWAAELFSRLGLNCPDVAPSETAEVIIGLAVEAERERCAKAAEKYGEDEDYDVPEVRQCIAGKDVAARIRENPPS